MGLLSQGSPLNWDESKKYADHVRKHGIIQFLNIYNKVKDRQRDVLKWGDEVRNCFLFLFCFSLFKLREHVEKCPAAINACDLPVMMVVHDATVIFYWYIKTDSMFFALRARKNTTSNPNNSFSVAVIDILPLYNGP